MDERRRIPRASWRADDEPALRSAAVRPPTPAGPAGALLALQRTAGNRSTAALVARYVTTPTSRIDRHSSMQDYVRAIAEHLVATEQAEKALGLEFVLDEVSHAVDPEGGFGPEVLDDAPTAIAVAAVPVRDEIRRLRDERHMRWLDAERAAFERVLSQTLGPDGLRGHTLRAHEDLEDEKTAAHYGALDADLAKFMANDMLWRFTSNPQTEVIRIDAGVSFADVVSIVGRHTGGNKKDDGRVRTLSFGRNLGALIGVAYSKGGDPNVAEIAVRAEYLYGVPLAGLQGQGITAHPAEARLIGIFETEYVLLATPGDPPRKLDDLATVRYVNPFQGMDGKQKARLLKGKRLASEMRAATGVKEPPRPPTEQSSYTVIPAPKAFSRRVWQHAQAVQAAATEKSGSVRMMEGADTKQIDNALLGFIDAIKNFTPEQAPVQGVKKTPAKTGSQPPTTAPGPHGKLH